MNYQRKDAKGFDLMWDFLQIGKAKANIPALIENLELLRTLMMQKTAGQREDKSCDVSFDSIETVKDIIVIETMCLWLSGGLAPLPKKTEEEEDNG